MATFRDFRELSKKQEDMQMNDINNVVGFFKSCFDFECSLPEDVSTRVSDFFAILFLRGRRFLRNTYTFLIILN